MTTPTTKHEDWLASDYDDPLETAILYKQVQDNPEGCGHAVKWNLAMKHLLEQRESTCPICTQPIAMIVDGGVASSPLTAVTTFKYGKQVFRLSCDNSAQPKSIPTMAWMIKFLMGTNHSVTAQERMAQAMGMNVDKGFKILHKGKVLFPGTNGKSSSSQRSSQQLSNRILEISRAEWAAHKKSALVVMGTRVGYELKLPPKPGLFQTILFLPIRITQLTIGICWNFVASFVRPLIGSSDDERREHGD